MNAEVWADPGGTALPIVCRVRDVSPKGARIYVNPGIMLPESFFLKMGDEMRRVRVVWRLGDHMNFVGVTFQSPDMEGNF
jgi:hypothetical protein